MMQVVEEVAYIGQTLLRATEVMEEEKAKYRAELCRITLLHQQVIIHTGLVVEIIIGILSQVHIVKHMLVLKYIIMTIRLLPLKILLVLHMIYMVGRQVMQVQPHLLPQLTEIHLLQVR